MRSTRDKLACQLSAANVKLVLDGLKFFVPLGSAVHTVTSYSTVIYDTVRSLSTLTYCVARHVGPLTAAHAERAPSIKATVTQQAYLSLTV